MQPSNTPDQMKFFHALARGDIEGLRTLVANNRKLLDSFDYRNFGATPVTMACFSGRKELVSELLRLGADPNRRSDWHMGPWSPLHCAVFRHDIDLARFLLEQGATPDAHTAAGLGDCELLKQLLDAEPKSVVERGGDGCQPLHFADSVEVAQILLERGAEIDGRCIDHYSTPAQYLCVDRPEVARYLFSKGAEADIFSSVLSGDDARVEQLLDERPWLMEARINQQFFPPRGEHDVHNILTFTVGLEATCLHAAARTNRRQSVSVLLRRGISPDVRGGYDQATPLHIAAWNNCVHSAESLLDGGADIDAKSGNIHNNSPAGWAIVAGSLEVLDLLLSRGATRHPWFLDDAKEACEGRFDQVSQSSPERRQLIFSRLSSL